MDTNVRLLKKVEESRSDRKKTHMKWQEWKINNNLV